MEKNGNTFAPGDAVTSTAAKIASAAVTGIVKTAADDGRLKVQWSDGTVTFERPEDLNKD